jgi:hypothetical protein
VEQGFLEEKKMNTRRYTKLVHEAEFVAEVDVNLVYSDEGWSPYLSLEDAYKLDDIREALRQGDVASASKLGKVYTLTPVAV